MPLDYSYENVKRALVDMHEISLDVPPYPQLNNFIEIYLRPLEAEKCLSYNRGLFFLSLDKIDCLNKASISIREAEDAIRVVRDLGLVFNALKAPVTGPFTLASRVYIDSADRGLTATCLAKKDLVLEVFSKFVARLIDHVIHLGYNIVFIDEPVFNYIIGQKKILFGYSEQDIVEVLSRLTSKANIEFGIHVCGRLNQRIVELLLEVPRIRYINIELHDSPSNLDLLNRSLFEKHDKYLAPGIVSAQKAVVEPVDRALSILESAYKRVGDRIDLVTGDCGFGGLRGTLGDREKEYEIAVSKLRIVVETVHRFKKTIGVDL